MPATTADVAFGVAILIAVIFFGFLYLESQIKASEKRIVSELTDLQTAITSAISELSSIASQLQALEGTTPAPGVLEGLATQLNAAVTAAQAAVAPPAAPAAPAAPSGS